MSSRSGCAAAEYPWYVWQQRDGLHHQSDNVYRSHSHSAVQSRVTPCLAMTIHPSRHYEIRLQSVTPRRIMLSTRSPEARAGQIAVT